MTARAEKRSAPRAPKESRHRAREAALQMLYQWEVGRLSMFEVHQTFWSHDDETDEPLGADLRAFASALADGVVSTVEELDPIIAEAAEHWRIERMNVMDRLILRLAVYEFLHRARTPTPRSSSTRRWSWRGASAATKRCASSTASSTASGASSNANEHR